MGLFVADARALAAGQYPHLVVYGTTAIGDGGGGLYTWNAAAANVDDGAAWLKPDSITHPAPGRWQRVWLPSLAATTLLAGIVMLGTDGETTAGEAVQCSDARLHPAASLSGTPAYITINTSTQAITRALIDLTAHVTGLLPAANIGVLTTVTETGTTRTNVAADRNQWVRWTSASAKTFTITTATPAAGDVWQGINAGTAGTLTLVGSGVTLTGVLTFAINKSYSVRFVSTTAADVVGGA